VKNFFGTVGVILFLAGLCLLAFIWIPAREKLEALLQGLLAIADWEG
jgi:hypothetical protein